MTKDEALKLALETFEELLLAPQDVEKEAQQAITAIREVLAQPEQEPFANYCKECLTYNGHHEGCSHYTAPPKRKPWVGLDADEVFELASGRWTLGQMAVLVEAKLKEKNT